MRLGVAAIDCLIDTDPTKGELPKNLPLRTQTLQKRIRFQRSLTSIDSSIDLIDPLPDAHNSCVKK